MKTIVTITSDSNYFNCVMKTNSFRGIHGWLKKHIMQIPQFYKTRNSHFVFSSASPGINLKRIDNLAHIINS